MNTRNIIPIVLVIAAGGFFLYALISYALNGSKNTNPAGSGAPQQAVAPDVQGETAAEAKTNNEGGIQITVQPKNISGGSATWDFDVALNTHSGDLAQDMAQVSTLIDGSGKQYAAIGWDGDLPGGHHREGVLKFKAIAPQPSLVTLVIRNVGGIKERKFTWQFEGQ